MHACGKEQEHLTTESGGSLFPAEKPESSTINQSRPFSLLAENLQFSSALILNHSDAPGVLLHQDVIPSKAVQQPPYSLTYKERKQKTVFHSDLPFEGQLESHQKCHIVKLRSFTLTLPGREPHIHIRGCLTASCA